MSNKTTTTLIIIGLMAVLAVATVSTFADSAFAARPGGVPPSTPPGAATGSCASAAQSSGASDCPKPDFGGP